MLDQLQDQVGDLQQEVEAAQQVFAGAVDVLQLIAAVLLGVEAFVLNRPAVSHLRFAPPASRERFKSL